MNRHSLLYGNDPASSSGQSDRGQRVLCSNRGQRGGCGRTFSIFRAEVLPRHTFTATLLGQLLAAWLAQGSVRSAAQSLRLPFALESVYHLLQRLRVRLDIVRCCLCRRQKAPESAQTDPLLQTIEHLQAFFAGQLCPVSEFQLSFQLPFMG